jgi:cytochrome c oxidase subunit III
MASASPVELHEPPPPAVAVLPSAHVAHQFDSPRQQFEAGKLGIWLFLMTEVLFFSGLFCAYGAFRSWRPEVFAWAHHFLDLRLGTLNTGVLLLSSLTAACAVRFAQLGARRRLVACLAATLVLACVFLGVKAVEYRSKIHEGFLPGYRFQPTEHVWERPDFVRRHPEAAAYAEKVYARAQAPITSAISSGKALPRPTRAELEPLLAVGVLGPNAVYPTLPSMPQNAHVFFSLYYFMTGLHAVHVLGGVGVLAWLLVRAQRGAFGPSYFGPVDYAALYWHLVDLIWIYLFPLLYLIH